MGRRTKKVQSFGEAAERTLRRFDKSGRRHGARVVGAWPEIVGSEIARHTKGFALRDDREMVVFVDSAAWANELSLMAAGLVERLNAHLGDETVKALRFTVSRRVAEERAWEAALNDDEESYEPDQVMPEGLSEVERMQVEHVASAITDPELREVAQRVMTKDLELKKGARKALSEAGSGAAREDRPSEG